MGKSRGRVARRNLLDDCAPIEERIAMPVWALGCPGAENSRWRELIGKTGSQLLKEHERFYPWLWDDHAQAAARPSI